MSLRHDIFEDYIQSVNPPRVARLIYISKEKTHKKWKQEIFWITNHDMWIEKESDVK